MKGMAFDWVLPFIRVSHNILQDYDIFVANFRSTFGNINCPRQAEHELLELKQGCCSVVEYIADFQRLSMEVGWAYTLPLCTMFNKGLNREIKQALCNFQCPNTLPEYFCIVAELDNHHIEFCQEFGEKSAWINPPPISHHLAPVTQDGIADMITGTVQRHGPLTSNEH